MAIPINCIGTGPDQEHRDTSWPCLNTGETPIHRGRSARGPPRGRKNRGLTRWVCGTMGLLKAGVLASRRGLEFCFTVGRGSADANYGGTGAGGGAHTFPLVLSALCAGNLRARLQPSSDSCCLPARAGESPNGLASVIPHSLCRIPPHQPAPRCEDGRGFSRYPQSGFGLRWNLQSRIGRFARASS